eukprot:Lankesteria_metandrocarpae@DN5459_c1_g1_i15.p1
MQPAMRLCTLICVCCLVLVVLVVYWVPSSRKYVSTHSRSAIKTFISVNDGNGGNASYSGTQARLIHLVWMTNPLKPYTISAIDSVLRYVPHATLKLHIITPQGTNDTVLTAVKRRFEYQLSQFIEHPGINLQIVLHPNVQAELKGTPLEKYHIPQQHFGGFRQELKVLEQGGDRLGTPFGPWRNALVHSADVMRVLIVWREGGLYLDVDEILLDNIWPLLEVVHAFIVCENLKDGQADGKCKATNGIFYSTKGHPFLWECMDRIALLIDEHGINGVWPLRKKAEGEPDHIWFTAVGPDLFAKVKNTWIDDRRDVWTVSGREVYPSGLTLHDVRHRPVYDKPINWDNSTLPLYILPRRYFIPTGWQDLTLNAKVDAASADAYTKAYGFHLWEMGKSGVNQIRPHYIELIRDKPDTVLAYLFRKYCLLFCDVSELQRVCSNIPPLNDFMTNTASPQR